MTSRRENGSFAILAVLALGACALVGGLYYIASSASGPKVAAVRPEEMFDRLREQAEKALSSPEAVRVSVPRNGNSFSCLFSALGDCSGKGTNFLLYETDEASAQPLSQIGLDSGLTADGFGCRGFPSAACPLRVEASWEPVCAAGGRCENTKSMNVKVKVTFNDGATKSPLDWEKSGLFSPPIQLSQNVTCERGGGVWANTECLTPEQASARNIASSRSPRVAADTFASAQAEAAANPVPITPDSPDQYICPNQIVVQGNYYPVDFISAGRGQVKVPAMNGCPADDIFVFQCNRKEPAQFESEGQWIQTEAVMAGADCQSQIGSGGAPSSGYERR